MSVLGRRMRTLRGSLVSSVHQKAAEMGCAWAQYNFAVGEGAKFANGSSAWLEKAVAQGEPDAMTDLAEQLWDDDEGNVRGRLRATLLWRQAAELGESSSQMRYAEKCCARDSVEYFEWIRRSAMQGLWTARRHLCSAVEQQLEAYDSGGSGRLLNEIGAPFVDMTELHRPVRVKLAEACERAAALHCAWRAAAVRAVLCWLWTARQLGVAKDMRVKIAGLIWDARAEWSENTRISGLAPESNDAFYPRCSVW